MGAVPRRGRSGQPAEHSQCRARRARTLGQASSPAVPLTSPSPVQVCSKAEAGALKPEEGDGACLSVDVMLSISPALNEA